MSGIVIYGGGFLGVVLGYDEIVGRGGYGVVYLSSNVGVV